jgi:hypothetical protein
LISTAQPDRRRLSQGLIASCIVLVAFLVLGAQSLYGQADALSIDKQGDVGIGHAPNENQTLLVVPQCREKNGKKECDMPLNVTNPEGNTNWLAVLSSGNVLMNGGNVGIGTTSPSNPLAVEGNYNNYLKMLRIYNKNEGDKAQAGIEMTQGSNTGQIFQQGNGYWLWNSANGPMNFFTNKTLRMIIAGDGNVGIGTDDPPKAKLDVNGSASFSKVGIGTKSPSSPLDVRGSFRVVNDDTNLQGFTGYWNDSYTWINLYKWSEKEGLQPLRVDGFVLSLNSEGGGNVGIGTTEPKQKLDVNGIAIIRGKLYAEGGLTYYWGGTPDSGWKNIRNREGNWAGSYNEDGPPSDLRFKTDLHPIPSALGKVGRLRGVTFHWNEQGLQYLTRDIESTLSAGPGTSDAENRKVWQAERDKRYKDLSATSVGVVAQDVEAVLPEAVTTDEAGYKQVAYHKLIPLLIEALKEEDKISKEQAQTIARQQSEIHRLTVATEAAQQQLNELQEVKQKLGRLEAAVNKFMVSGLSGNEDELASAGQGPAGVKLN